MKRKLLLFGLIVVLLFSFAPLSAFGHEWPRAHPFYEGAALVHENGYGLWGLIDTEGEYIVPHKYTDAKPFGEGLAAVEDPGHGSQYGFIDSTGKVILDFQYDYVEGSFSEERAVVGKVNAKTGLIDTFGFIDRAGKLVVSYRYSDAKPFKEGLAAVCTGVGETAKWGFIDKEGNAVIKPRFAYVDQSFTGGLACVSDEAGKAYLIDRSGKTVLAPEPDCAIVRGEDAFSEGLVLVRDLRATETYNFFGFMNEQGELVIPCTYGISVTGDRQPHFSEGLTAVIQEGKLITLNQTGGIIGRRSMLYPCCSHTFSEGLLTVEQRVGVQEAGFVSAMDAYGNLVLPFSQYITDFHEGYAAALNVDNEWVALKNPLDAVSRYKDVSPEDWFYGAVASAGASNLMNGVSEDTFAPQGNVSRGMLAAILYRLEGEPEVPFQPAFSDVPEGQWYSKAISWAYKEGIVSGKGDGTFGVQEGVNREQLAAMIYRCETREWTSPPNITHDPLSLYTDGEKVSSWAKAPMEWAIARGLIKGASQTLLIPGALTNRAECAAILMRYQTDPYAFFYFDNGYGR